MSNSNDENGIEDQPTTTHQVQDAILREKRLLLLDHAREGDGEDSAPLGHADMPMPTALCLSGGGARSATFSLGVLQALAHKEWLTKFTYLSTVSGGGFIGGWLTRWRTEDPGWTQKELKETPDGFQTDPDKLHRVRRLRSFGNYLAPTAGFSQDSIRFASSFLRKSVLNLAFWLMLFVALAIAVRMLVSGYQLIKNAVAGNVDTNDASPADKVEAANTAEKVGEASPSFDFTSPTDWASAITTGDAIFDLAIWSVLALAAVYILLSIASMFASLRSWISEEKWSVFSGQVLSGTLIFTIVVILFGVFPEIIWDELSVQYSSGARVVAFAAVAIGLIASVSGYWSRLPAPLQLRVGGLVDRLKGFYLELISALAIASMAVAAGYCVRWITTDVLGYLPERTSINIATATAAGARNRLNEAEAEALRGSATVPVTSTEQATGMAAEGGRAQSVPSTDNTASTGAVREKGAQPTSLTETTKAGAVMLPDGTSCPPPTESEKSEDVTDTAQLKVERARIQYCDAYRKLDGAIKNFKTDEDKAYADLWKYLLPPLGIILLAAVFLSLLTGANRSSLHSLYSGRLIRAYLGTTTTDRTPRWPTDFDEKDDVSLAQALQVDQGKRPFLFPVINMTVNFKGGIGERRDWQQRRGGSFTATPLNVGSDMLGDDGYVPTGKAVHSETYGGMTLGRAMTISGAAASPNMGYYSRSLVTFAMSILNVRLGWWFPNPSRLRTGADGQPLPRAFEPITGVFHALKEAFGSLRSTDKWLYLSDGGHFDNLGLYEMVRRRCREILVIDAGCDGAFEYDDLLQTVRRISVDFGIEIELPSILPGQEGDGSGERALMAKIHYSKVDPKLDDGYLVLIKPMLTGAEPPGMARYRERSKSGRHAFPHHSTVDQFFDEEQFESYRALGFLSVMEALRDLPEDSFGVGGKGLEEFYFENLSQPDPHGPVQPKPALVDGPANDDAAPTNSGVVAGILSLFKGDTMGEIAAKVAGVVAASTITYTAADTLATAAVDRAGQAAEALVTPTTQDSDGENDEAFELIRKALEDRKDPPGITNNYEFNSFQPVQTLETFPDSIKLDDEQFGKMSGQFGSLKAQIKDLDIKGTGRGISESELEAALKPIADDINGIEDLLAARLSKQPPGNKPEDPRIGTIVRGIKEIKNQLTELEDNPNFGALQNQIDFLIGRLNRIEQQAKAQGSRS